MRGIDLVKMFGSSTVGGGGGSPSGSGVDITNVGVHGDTYAQWVIGNDGLLYKRTTVGSPVSYGVWITPQSGMALYDIRASFISGDLPDGDTIGSWLNLGTTRTWGWADIPSESCQLLMEIRLSATGAVVDSATVTISTKPEFDPTTTRTGGFNNAPTL